jgi:hypothetical protein
MENNVNVEILQKKIRANFENKIPVHIIYKNGIWKNGNITEIHSADFFMLNDFLEGLMPIFYLEIAEVKVYTKRKEAEI